MRSGTNGGNSIEAATLNTLNILKALPSRLTCSRLNYRSLSRIHKRNSPAPDCGLPSDNVKRLISYNSPGSTVSSNCASTRSHVGKAPTGAEMLSLKALGFLFVRDRLPLPPLLPLPPGRSESEGGQPTHRPPLPGISVRYGASRPTEGGRREGMAGRSWTICRSARARACFGLVMDF